MGRISKITFEAVRDAAQNLELKGKNPTIELVREELGSGSYSTIAPLLRDYRAIIASREIVTVNRGEFRELEHQNIILKVDLERAQKELDVAKTQEPIYEKRIWNLDQEWRKWKQRAESWERAVKRGEAERLKLSDKLDAANARIAELEALLAG